MHGLLLLVSLLALGSFVAGVVFHKYVFSEAQSIKLHVTSSVAGAESRLKAALENAVSKASILTGRL